MRNRDIKAREVELSTVTMSVNISDSDSDMPPEQPPERVDYEKNFLRMEMEDMETINIRNFSRQNTVDEDA